MAYDFFNETFIVFETIISLVIVVSCLLVYLRTRELFSLSLQKGIKYFSNAYLLFTICFTVRYVLNAFTFFSNIFETLPSFALFLRFIIYFTASLGGFYLAYSIMWRKFESDFSKRINLFRNLFFIIAAILISLIELYLLLAHGIDEPFVFLITMMVLLLSAILVNCKQFHCYTKKVTNPFVSTVGLGFGIFFAIFLGTLLFPIIPTAHFYIWGIVTIFFVTATNNVLKYSK
ncbi:hypothetical protein ACFLZX_00980 [Nanoarchaeota archaeon]